MGLRLRAGTAAIRRTDAAPTEPDAWLLIVTTAGFSGESQLLERLYERGLAGTRLDEELEIYRADDLVMFWSHTPRQPWQKREQHLHMNRHIAI